MEDRAIPSKTGEVTTLLRELASGQSGVVDRLLPLVYEQLKILARRQRRMRGPGVPISTQSLVHEAYMRMIDQTLADWATRRQFFHLASIAMRGVLVDNARYAMRLKREGRWQQIDLSEELLLSAERADELVALDEALTRLRLADQRLADIVDCRFFGGLSIEETADALSLSPATVKRGWTAARTWLFKEIGGPLPAAG